MLTLFLLSTGTLVQKAAAQVHCDLSELLQREIRSEQDLWQFRVDNRSGDIRQITIKIQLQYINGETALESVSPVVEANTGVNHSTTLNLQFRRIFTDKSDSMPENAATLLPEGRYLFCVSVTDAETLAELDRTCQEISVQRVKPPPGKSVNDRLFATQQYLELKGTLIYETQVASRKGSYQDIPQNYQFLQFVPSFTVLGIPLKANLFFSDMQKPALQPMNILQLNFDAGKYREMVRKRADAEKAKGFGMAKALLEKKDSLFREASKLEKVFSSEVVQREMNRMQLLDSIDVLLRDSAAYMDSAQLGNLLYQRSRFKDIEQKRKSYKELTAKYGRLLAQKDSLTALLKNADLSDSVQQQLPAGKWKRYADSLLQGVEKFSVGTCFPDYNDLTLKNVSLKGVHLAGYYHRYYAAFSAGKLRRAAQAGLPHQQVAERKHYSAGLGIGKKESTYARVYYLYSEDLPEQGKETAATPSLRSNRVINMEAGYASPGRKLTVESAVAVSSTENLTENNRMFYPEQFNYGTATPVLSRGLFFRSGAWNAVYDYAYRVAAKGQVSKNSEIQLVNKRTGANYESFGIPYLMKDLLATEGKYKQRFFRNKLTASASLIWSQDNLNHTKVATTSRWQSAYELAAQFPRFPMVRVSYTPFVMNNDLYHQQMNALNVFSSYTFRHKAFTHAFQAFYIDQVSMGSIYGYSVNTFSLTYTGLLAARHSLSAGYSNTTLSTNPGPQHFFMARAGTLLSKKIKVEYGCQYMYGTAEKRLVHTARASYSYKSYLRLELAYTGKDYRRLLPLAGPENNPADFNENLFNTSLYVSW